MDTLQIPETVDMDREESRTVNGGLEPKCGCWLCRISTVPD